MDVGKYIRQLRLQNGFTQEELGEKVGVQKAAVQKWENGTTKNLKREVIQKLADLFDVDVANFFYEEKRTTVFEKYDNIKQIDTRRYPILGEIACGKPIYADEKHESYIEASSSIHADFCLIAKGDSMINARINSGDVVFIRNQSEVENGEIAAVIIDDEATLKRVYYYSSSNKLVLSPENPKYEPLVYVGEELNDIRILGKAICFMSNL